jgi:hypothetical protein
MKRLVLGMAAAAMLLASGAASARDVIIGTDVVATSDNEANLFYQGRAFNHSAFRISGSSVNNNIGMGLGFRFYFERYADSPYIQAEIDFANNNSETGAKVGIDLRLGNIIIDPYFSTFTNRSFGLNVGLRL